MSQTDKLKETIAYFKVIFILVVSVGVTLSGWLASSYAVASILKLASAIFLLLILGIMAVILNRKILQKIDELEEL